MCVMKLTKPQEIIWQMEQFVGGAISVICTSLIRAGNQDEEKLQEIVDFLFLHNDALRIRIQQTGSDVTQYVHAHESKDVPVLRFADVAELTEYAEQYAKVALNMNGPLCEMKILMLPDQFGLLVKVHHLIADAWTMALLATQFNLLLDGEHPQCGSYQSYFEREKEYLNSKRYSRDKNFFLDLIRDTAEPVLLSDQPAETLASERACFIVPKEFAVRLREFAEQENISVLSAFSTVVACYISRIHANAERVFLGTTVLNRMNETEMHTAGMYVNSVPVLVTMEKDRSFREVLEETEDMLMSVFRHQRYNYTQLQKHVAKEFSMNGPLYDVTLHYVNAAVDHGHPETKHMWHHNGVQNESLQIHIDDRNREGTFCLTYDYQIAKFTKREIQRLHTCLMNMLRDGMENPKKECHGLHMLSGEEEWQLRFAFNNTEKTYAVPKDATVSSLFEENAERNHTKPCVFMDGRSVTYGTFLRCVRNVDAEVRRKTDSQKSVVAVIADRSVQLYCALYGIIRGGNAYLPILPETPKERIRHMLKNSGAALVLAQHHYMGLVDDVPCVDLSAELPEADVSVRCAAEPQDTAYVMYTSGSTGAPKGVKISHASVINRILWMQDTYPLQEDSVILQKTVYGFDVSVWEIFWWGMCAGAMAVSLPGEHAVPAKILREISRNKITHLHFVPSVFDLFLNYLERNEEERSKFHGVKHVFLSGEKLETGLVNRFYRMFDHTKVQLHNLYGPTECTVDVTYYDCVPNETVIPIGKPIYNTQAYIVDQNLNLLPIGFKGELVIGGQNVGEGYVNEPNLTKQRFIDNPFGAGKLYKTGDIAYWREDGQIIYCDRMDTQVKINGQRIELAEIETVLKGIPEVDTAAVIVREEQGRKLLVAYYCGSAQKDDVILAECEKKLPQYMIPHLIRVDSLPIHSNGKLNRKMLSELPITLPEGESIEPPINTIEKHICNVFCSVLNQQAIGRNSDFFALGGDSLAVIAFLAESGYERQITAAQFIGNPTPAKLASLIMSQRKDTMKYVQTIYKPEKVTKAYVLIPFAGGNAEVFSNLAKSIMARDDTVAMYYVPYLHDVVDCETAAEELAALTQESDVYFYSHCAGAAVAQCILQSIERKHGAVIKQYYAAGHVPVKTCFGFNVWNLLPDSMLLRILKKAGAPSALLQNEIAGDIPGRFRQDTDFAAKYFSQNPGKYHCPTTLIFGRKDLFTRFFSKAEKQWCKYAQRIEKVYYIETDNHYFHSEESDLLAELLLSGK